MTARTALRAPARPAGPAAMAGKCSVPRPAGHVAPVVVLRFCPGDCGSLAGQLITVLTSRLEASGEARDEPFEVEFQPETRNKRFWF